MGNYSPLRYPGGKSALYPAISGIIKSNKMDHCIYVEPFAGGANIAWSLLIDGVVDFIFQNQALSTAVILPPFGSHPTQRRLKSSKETRNSTSNR